jgi:hypothetical protein
MKRTAVVSSATLAANLAIAPAFAACAVTPESYDTLVRGRFVRCENARFHLEASGAYRRHERDLEAALARIAPENRERFLERIGGGVLTTEYEARVAVVDVQWHVPIVPWLPGNSTTVEFKDVPRELGQTIRFWWSASIDACEDMAAWSFVDLWVHSPCCDTFEFQAPVCIVRMSFAEPVSDEMSAALSKALGNL